MKSAILSYDGTIHSQIRTMVAINDLYHARGKDEGPIIAQLVEMVEDGHLEKVLPIFDFELLFLQDWDEETFREYLELMIK